MHGLHIQVFSEIFACEKYIHVLCVIMHVLCIRYACREYMYTRNVCMPEINAFFKHMHARNICMSELYVFIFRNN